MLDVICLSHLRWDFVYQRPQHLMRRTARDRRVFYVEEPSFGAETPQWELLQREEICVAVPRLPHGLGAAEVDRLLRELIDQLLTEQQVHRYVLWYYTPMALEFSRQLTPAATVYDCMDELSAFAFAPAQLRELERELLERADLVFTGGASLFEAKRDRHPSVHLFPSSVDVAHFAQARQRLGEPPDQRDISRPRLGYFGVIDERIDYDLLAGLAETRPAWQLVMVGPTCKIDPRGLPAAANIHYLGGKSYQDLPSYLAGWDVALLPFALNEATRSISPTKTPEYLAAGKPVVSTPIRDVVRTYGELGLVQIAAGVDELVRAVETALAADPPERLPRVDAFLAQRSWDETWRQMWALIESHLRSGPGSDSTATDAGPLPDPSAARR